MSEVERSLFGSLARTLLDAAPPDVATLDDPDLFAERRRVREALEALPPYHDDRRPLADRYAALTAEFDRRASDAWRAPQ